MLLYMTNYWVLSNKFSITNTYLLKLYIARANCKVTCSARVKLKNLHPSHGLMVWCFTTNSLKYIYKNEREKNVISKSYIFFPVGQPPPGPPLDRTCNPSLLSIFQQTLVPTLAPLEIENQTTVVIIGTKEPILSSPYLQWWDAQSIVGLAIFILCILYSRYDWSARQTLAQL